MISLAKDLIGKVYGRLTVICRAPRPEGIKTKSAYWLCKCSCGNEKITNSDLLNSQRTRSCGCLLRESSKKRSYKHGYYGTRLYQCYVDMVRRCHNEKEKWYANYGAKGIEVCEEWRNNPKSFFDWSMQNGYDDNLTIDRIDNNGNYTEENCRWTTQSVQNFNKGVRKNSTTGHTGVSFNKNSQKYVAYICKNNENTVLGYFSDIKDAIEVRIQAEKSFYD